MDNWENAASDRLGIEMEPSSETRNPVVHGDDGRRLTWPGEGLDCINTDEGWTVVEAPRRDQQHRLWAPLEPLGDVPAAAVIGQRILALRALESTMLNRVALVYADLPRLGFYRPEDGGLELTTWLTLVDSHLKASLPLLSEDGFLAVHIDEAGAAYARTLLDDLLGGTHHVATALWQKKYAPQNDLRGRIDDGHDFVFVYSKAGNSTPKQPFESTWWSYDIAGKTEDATREFEKLRNEGIIGLADVPKTSKPRKLLSLLIEKLTSPGDWVVDMFSDTGFASIAAVSLKRKPLYLVGGSTRELELFERCGKPVIAHVLKGEHKTGSLNIRTISYSKLPKKIRPNIKQHPISYIPAQASASTTVTKRSAVKAIRITTASALKVDGAGCPPMAVYGSKLETLTALEPVVRCEARMAWFNFVDCPNVAFVGLSDSYEQFYQAIRRCWRFGQTSPVNCYVITADTEGAVVRNIERKEQQSQAMMEGMVIHMKNEMQRNLKGTSRTRATYAKSEQESPSRWKALLGDVVDHIVNIPTDSIDYSIFSPPFASLYTYSNSERDMGNCKDYEVFAEHFKFLVPELLRILKPGRLLSFHCMNLTTTKEHDGVIGLRDFRGDLIRMFTAANWIYHSEVCIWKDPVTAMQRTKALGLLYKQLRKDSAMSRQGVPDYLVTMRKPGLNPDPVRKLDPKDKAELQKELARYNALSEEEKHQYWEATKMPVETWQRYASPVWMDINQSDTLTRKEAREHDDERHICALQLGVIERALELWTNPEDLVFSPFMGIGSEGYVAVRMKRRFIGTELKRSYFEQACKNLKRAETLRGPGRVV